MASPTPISFRPFKSSSGCASKASARFGLPFRRTACQLGTIGKARMYQRTESQIVAEKRLHRLTQRRSRVLRRNIIKRLAVSDQVHLVSHGGNVAVKATNSGPLENVRHVTIGTPLIRLERESMATVEARLDLPTALGHRSPSHCRDRSPTKHPQTIRPSK